MPAELVIDQLRTAGIGPIDLVVPAGGCIVVGGPSGAGKSRLLRAIVDLDPNEGAVRLGATDRRAIPASAWRSKVVYLAAEAGWWASTPADHIPPDGREIAKALADRLGLGAGLDQSVATLSTGERQRLALVRALARRPTALLLDEPTSSLDAASIETVEDMLRDQMAAGTTLLVVSHDPAQTGRLGARRATMQGGRLAPA